MTATVAAVPNRRRKGWVAVVLSLVVHPAVAMLYVGRPRRAATYLALLLLLPLAPFAIARMGLWPAGWPAMVVLACLTVIGSVDAYRIARRHVGSFTGSWYTTWVGLLGAVVGVLALLVCVRMFLVDWFYVPSASMSPTVVVEDHVLVNKLSYVGADPRRGDVAVIRLADRSVNYVKRVIGLPGDTVVYDARSKRLTVNGDSAELDVLGPSLDEPSADVVRETIGQHANLLWQTRDALSRGGTYDVPEDHYFVLGDNRDNSQDSRYAEFGFVPREGFVGKVVFIFWNTDEPTRAGTSVD